MIEIYDLRRLSEDGETLSETLERTWLTEQLGRDGDLQLAPLADGHAELELTPIGSHGPLREPVVRITGRLTAALSTPCVRCLADLTLALEARPDLTMFPAPPAADADHRRGAHPGRGPKAKGKAKDSDEDAAAEALDPGEADSGTYTEMRLDLPSIVREALLLEIPMHPACADEAACAARTQTLIASVTPTEEAGGDTPTDPRWAALAALKAKLT